MSSNPSGPVEDDYARKICMKYAGPYFDRMLQSYQATRDLLQHPDPRARLGALGMIREYWKPPPDFAQLCERMAREDPDVDVRCMALNCLIPAYYYGSEDLRIGRWLAEIVRDQSQAPLFRKIAYVMLFAVRATDDNPLAHTLQFPEQVDWSFVNTFLS
jgi:hypothetical protein